MGFTHFDLGNKKLGQTLAMKLAGSIANVRLMDSPNFQNYIHGRSYKYFGGLIKQSSYKMQIPNSGHWHVIVDMRGLWGNRTNYIWIRTLPTDDDIADEITEIIEFS